ncbi:MAG TPA: hypothetical protein VGP97_00615 [Burkholderiales bacterium]|jgi:hypothetical protein|nr:hypothetical protein [Burkholderiales bacterium]
MVEEKQQTPPLQPMISLAIVAKLAYLSAIGAEQADENTLNHVARVIASSTDIFDCRPVQSGAKPTLLTPDEIRSGRFGGGGLTLNFNDAWPSRTNLCIRVVDVGRVIVEINGVFRPPL